MKKTLFALAIIAAFAPLFAQTNSGPVATITNGTNSAPPDAGTTNSASDSGQNGTNVSYLDVRNVNTTALVIVRSVKYSIKLMDYIYFIDGTSIEPDRRILNILPGEHVLRVLDESNRLVYSETFSLQPGEERTLWPNDEGRGRWSWGFHVMGGNFVTGGIFYYLSRNLWVGVNTGASAWYDTNYSSFLGVLTFSGVMGYYFLGDREQDIRMGLGAGVYFNWVVPDQAWLQIVTNYRDYTTQGSVSNVTNVNYPNFSYAIDIYTVVDWREFFASLHVRHDFTRPEFLVLPSIGMRFDLPLPFLQNGITNY